VPRRRCARTHAQMHKRTNTLCRGLTTTTRADLPPARARPSCSRRAHACWRGRGRRVRRRRLVRAVPLALRSRGVA
jgi:hypothetical protein